jgi:transglutaminase-like putative cysteine protease
MRLNASCEIDFDADHSVAAILMLRPRSGWGQWVSREEYDFRPRLSVTEYTDIFGNLCQRVVIPSGRTTVLARCTVDAPNSVDVEPWVPLVLPPDLPESVLPLVLSSRFCPADQLVDLALEVTRGALPGYPQVEAIRTWIKANIRYEYGHSTPTTTALDTARDRIGVCRDFTHLGIALCRALNIPARMVAGYSLILATPDLHAWFEAYLGNRWYVFDATQDQTTGDRIAIAYGRDATDVALVTSFGRLNTSAPRVAVEAAAS